MHYITHARRRFVSLTMLFALLAVVVPLTVVEATPIWSNEAPVPITLLLSPKTEVVNLRGAPGTDQPIVDVVYNGEKVEVTESYREAVGKIGVRDKWIQVRKGDAEGWTAAWLYEISDTIVTDPAEPVPGGSGSGAAAEALFITPLNGAIRIRTEPVNGSVVDVARLGERIEVLEPVDAAASKVGARGEWLPVRTADGTTGYTAAWLYTFADTAPDNSSPVPTVRASVAAPDTSARLYVTPTGSDIRVRAEPVSGRVVHVTAPGEMLEVIEPVDAAVDKIGQDGEWVQVRTLEGVEGYTAAWLYTIAELVLPEAPVGIPPLGGTPDDRTSPWANTLTHNSILALGVTPASRQVALTEPIAPLSGSILALGVGEPGEAADLAAPVDTEPVVGVEVEPVAVDPEPVNVFSNMVPITIRIEDSTEIEVAELAINGQNLAVYTAQPYEYDLDAGLLSAGDYRLTFMIISPNGIVHASDLYFEVKIDDSTAPAAPSIDGEAVAAAGLMGFPGPESAPLADPAPARRILLIDGEARPFDLAFSIADGLVPAVAESADAVVSDDNPSSLVDVLSGPVSSIIPEPLRATLMTPRPTLAAIIILAMMLTLVPQGLFTIYWMTYTWNNPKVAERYRSPREFVAPQVSFTALLPARHEEGVIKDTIRAVNRINYPEHLKEILILIRDEDDDATINAAREAIQELGSANIRLITFTDGPRNKPNGLNKGLRASTKDVVCVFDAEDEPHPDIYNVVNTVMVRDGSDVVQSGVQLMNFRSTWFSALNVLEYFFWFKSGLHAFTRQFAVTPLGGNTVFFKRHLLERINGWDDQCLTEDADVGLRLTGLGAKIQIVYDAEHATQEETPDTVESFIKQRTRWNQGFYQIFFKGDWMRLPTMTQKIVALYILLNSLLQAAMFFYIPVGLYIALTQQVSVPVALFSYVPIYILLLQMLINLVGIREFTSAYGQKLPLFFSLKMMVFFYPYQLMLSFAALRAVYRFVTQKQAWEKTAHSNLHRQGQTINEARVA
ncbi:MAG: glycosyltransferase [Chloroflexi bacterium]|nr:glycosyltransferase [Chloroflexota bacterium]